MAKYDVLVGMDSSTLNKALLQLYAKSDARENLFKGVANGEISEVSYDIGWDIADVPAIQLEPFTNDEWKASIGPDGNPVGSEEMPGGNIFTVLLPLVVLKITGSEDEISITKLKLICKMECSNNIKIIPLAIYEKDSSLADNENDSIIFNCIIVPALFTMLCNNLGDLSLPKLPESVFDVKIEMSDIVAAIKSKLLIMAAIRKGETVDLSDMDTPTDKPFFILLNPAFIIGAVKPKIDETISTLKQDGSGSESGFKWSYSASVNKLAMEPNPANPTQITCGISVSLSGGITALGGLCAAEGALKQ